ncbi:hypothetical protein J5X84_43145 [Streptosporangiaceae bacterium NEAU-GS5]|nr:hypothetical protein [Streptosporangiaceae bacterium NEAU-GS5]
MRTRPYFWLTAAERRLWDAFPTGAWVDARGGKVRAAVIAALLLGSHPLRPGHVAGVRLSDARITGDLDLSDAVLSAKLHLVDCRLPGIVSLNDARTRGIRLRRCEVGRFRAGRATVDGLLDLSGSVVRHGVRLDNAHVTGQLRMSGARISAPSERISPPSEAGSTSPDYAIWAGGLRVEGGAFLRDLHTEGGLRLVGARFEGGLYAERAHIKGVQTRPETDAYMRPPEPRAIVADHMSAAGVEFGAGFTAEGTVRLRGARIAGVLSFDGAALTAPHRCLHLSHMQVVELVLRPAKIEGEINLAYSRIGVLADDASAYPGHVHLNGLVYESVRGPADVADRLRLLARDPGGYRPQPFEQLAAFYRRVGHEGDARRVLLAKLRARRRTLRWPARVSGALLDVLVGYGYRPWLAGIWAVLLLATGTAVFGAVTPHQIGLDESRHFNAFTYTLDLLVPVSVFEQRGAWEPVGWTLWLANVLIGAGWILATALIAGGTRVLRPGGPS